MLSLVHPWPAHARAEAIADGDDVSDLAIRACRSVAELYSDALRERRIANRHTELRLFHRHDPARRDVLASVLVDPVRVGFESAVVIVPSGFADRTAEARHLTLVDAVHGILTRLTPARGWDPAALEHCRRQVLERGPEYRWTSPAKASPDRRHEASAEFRLTDDGYGRVRLRVRQRGDGSTVAVTDEALAFCTSQGFRRAAASMRWQGRDHVALVPYDRVPAVRGGLVSLTRDGDTWTGAAEDHSAVRDVPAGDPSLPPLPVRVEGRGRTAEEQPARIAFVGGGPIQSRRIERFFDAFGSEMDRFASAAGQEWWQDAGLRELSVQIRFQTAQDRVRARRVGDSLSVHVDQSDQSLPTGDASPRAREVAAEVVALVRRRTGLGPHPELG